MIDTPSLAMAAVILAVMWAWAEFRLILAQGRAEDREQMLLNRIQARSSAEYKAFQEVDEPKRPVVRRDPVYQSHAVAPTVEPEVDVADAQIVFGRLGE